MSIRVGVIGLGFGKAHIKQYIQLEDVEVTAVCERSGRNFNDPIVVESRAKKYQDAVEMLSREKLDAVSVCTPPKTHAPLTISAAERGIHVLCEKPMAPTLADCDEMIRACRKNRVKLMIGFKHRFAPAYMELKKRMKSELGPPFCLFLRYACTGLTTKDWLWEEDNGGGPIVENTVHATDLMRFLSGDVKRVYAEGDNFLAVGKNQIDTVVFTLRFNNGCVAAVRAGCWVKGPLKREHLLAYFPGATAEVEGPFDAPDNLCIWREADEKLKEMKYKNDNDGIRGEIAHFIDCVRNDRQPRASGQDGRSALAICLAVKQSATTKLPVTL